MPKNDGEQTTDSVVRRHLVGLIGIALVAVGLWFYAYPPASGNSEILQGPCVKSGVILMIMWLAFPQLDKMPFWLFGSVISGLLAVAIRPRIVLAALRYSMLFVPILIAIWFLRPKQRRRR